MYISHISNVIQQIAQDEWDCRRRTKGLNGSEYWAWIETITDADGVVTYPSENFTIAECTDEDVTTRLAQLSDYIGREDVYNIKYYASKRNAEEILDSEGKSYDPKQYVQSHFVGDDTAKDARLLADKWENVRRERNSKLAETDFWALGDAPSAISNDQQIYRQKLRDVPKDNSDPDNIAWPTKP